ncbi:MAG: DUF2073 domain-containing protein [Candidatus Aenigmatarchaeota archaeon]
MAKKKKDGIKIEFLSRENLKEKNFDDKLGMIMDKVRDENILVLEEALGPEEKASLIERSMEEVDDDFPGIEFSGFDPKQNWFEKMFQAITGRKQKDGLLIVGSSDIMEKLEEDKDEISLLAKLE